jgi:hypothetical protein
MQHIVEKLFMKATTIATLALGPRLKQRLTRLRTKKEAEESHLMPPGVQKNVRE